MKLLKFKNTIEAKNYIKKFIEKRTTSRVNVILEFAVSMILFKSSIDNQYYIDLKEVKEFL